MSWARRRFPAEGIVAIFDEPNQTGDVHDIDAARNAPAKTPADHLDKIYFHSALDYLEVLASATVTINHAAVSAGAGVSGSAGQDTVFQWGGVTADHLLLDLTAHGLAEEPFVVVATADQIIWPGMPVQTESGGRARYATAYSTTTAVRLWETASRTSNALSAASIEYTVLAFRKPSGDLNDILQAFDPDTGEFQMGRGRFSSLRRYLQIAPGGSPLGLTIGRTIDLNNGAMRAVEPDGTAYDPVPAVGVRVLPGTGAYGSSIAYGGSFTNTGGIEVQDRSGGGDGTKGFVFDPIGKTMSFLDADAATLVIPDSFPVLLLPEVVTIDDHDAVLPDVPKDRMFVHQWTISRVVDGSGTHYSHSGVGRCHVTATPQEYSSTTNLVAVPGGADIFVGQVRLQRTVNPTHNWIGSAIPKMVPENVWISLPTGSALLEAHLGFSRALSLYISGGNLVLHRQQSVSVAPGGYGTFGNGEPASYSSFGSFPASGGETVFNSLAGYPVYYGGDASPQYKTQVYTDDTDVFGNPTVPQANRKTGSNPPSTSDPTNFGATWRIDIRGQFGRRS